MPSFSNKFEDLIRPQDVGIHAIELYFPSQCVDQKDLEKYDELERPGKYTEGLGQRRMGFCDDREDIHSLCLTVLSKLMEKTKVGYENIGRLEVGTETLLDKSKSVKSVLMQLFEPSGNKNVEGVDCTNACYGGTSALFNAINWVESSYYEKGKYAVVVAGDIAVYKDKNARPTGGAGAVAMLVGPNAPLVFEKGIRGTYMHHVYDFYKPNLSSEYAKVDGKLTLESYFSALDGCYRTYKEEAAKRGFGQNTKVDNFDAILFHTPFCKQVQKSFARLVFADFLECPQNELHIRYPHSLEKFRHYKLEDTYSDRDVQNAFLTYSKEQFESKTKPSLLVASNVGNMYTASLYGGLASLLANCSAENLPGKRIALFSYGSGMAASFFSLRVSEDVSKHPVLCNLVDSQSDIKERLDKRTVVSPEVYASVMDLREKTHSIAPYTPNDRNRVPLFPGTFYLTNVDEHHRRTYARVDPIPEISNLSAVSQQALKSFHREGTSCQPIANGHSDANGDMLQVKS